MLVLFYVLAALMLGGYTTYLLATAPLPSLLDRASHHGRFAGLGSDTPDAVSDTKSDTAADTPPAAQPVSDENTSRC